MDYDADGILDFVSGSYDPGDLYLFRGLGRGKYAARRTLLDEAGVPLVHHPQELVRYQRFEKGGDQNGDEAIRFRVASFGSWPATVDWDGDGDLDLLIGAFNGTLWRRMNVGTRKEPRFAPESIQVAVGGENLKVHCHANPQVADWNGDGRWDLLVSSGDGSVQLHLNSGTAREPHLAEAAPLIEAKSESKFVTYYLAPDEVPRPGVRAQICVTDFDGDQKLDLLLGDYAQHRRLKSGTQEARKSVDELNAKLGWLRTQVAKLSEQAPSRASLEGEIKEVRNQLEDLLVAGEAATTSYVWLFRRR